MTKYLIELLWILFFLLILDNSLFMLGILYANYVTEKYETNYLKPLLAFILALTLINIVPVKYINFTNYSLGLVIQGIISLSIIKKIKQNNEGFYKNTWVYVLLINISDLSLKTGFQNILTSSNQLISSIIESLSYSLLENPFIHFPNIYLQILTISIIYYLLIKLITKIKNLEFMIQNRLNKEIILVLLLDGILRFFTGLFLLAYK